MIESSKKRLCPPLISPVPRRSSQFSPSTIKRNPFSELPLLKIPGHADEDLLTKELRQILSKPCPTLPPIQKSTPSPSFFSKPERPPTRQKTNPLVNDEKFKELNSSLSTCESWTDKSKQQSNKCTYK